VLQDVWDPPAKPVPNPDDAVLISAAFELRPGQLGGEAREPASASPCGFAPISSSPDRKLGHIDKFPRIKVWAQAVAERPSTHSFPPAEYEAMYRDMVRRRNKWISQFVDGSKAAAE
jgi:hypothetical protein